MVAWLAALGVAPEDSADERLRKASLTLANSLIATMAVVWVVTYGSLGLWRSAAIPFAYQVASVATLVVFARTRRFAPYRTAQLSMMFALPMLLQASLGGFRPSSAVVLWSVTAPLGALLFVGLRRATPWFVAFLIGVALLGVIDSQLSGEGHVPAGVVVTFFVLNVAGVSTTIYLLLRYFIGERDRIQSELEAEQERSERLLLNVLPAPIARRLKDEPGVIADTFDEVTVLFADIVGFTEFADGRSAAEVVDVLNEVFSAFDDLADRHGLEKIKTIGDAYMVVGGLQHGDGEDDRHLPVTHAGDVADMGLAMLDELAGMRIRDGGGLEVRVGMHVGPAVAGVIGLKKFIYDVWGDTVNTASRMESTGVPGRIQVTRETYGRLEAVFDFERRGMVDVKGKGPIETWFVIGRRPAGKAARGSADGATTRASKS